MATISSGILGDANLLNHLSPDYQIRPGAQLKVR